MKIKTPLFFIKIDILFIIAIFIFLISSKAKKILNYFVICYLFIVFHEASHMFVGVILGKEIEIFNIGLFGVNVSFKSNHYEKNLKKECRKDIINDIIIYIAGPFSNFMLAIAFFKIKLVFDMNIFLGILNLIPIYPLDGYNIFKSSLKLINCKEKEITKIVNIVNYFLFFILFLFGLGILYILYNPSLILFLIYLILLKNTSLKYINKSKYYK